MPISSALVPEPDAEQELHDFFNRKQRAYRVALTVAILTVWISWLLRGPSDPFITYAYPVFAALYLALLIASAAPGNSVERMEKWLFSLAGTHVLSRLIWHYFAVDSIEENLLILVGGHYWALGLLVVACAVILGRHRGLVAGLVLLVLSAAIAISGLWADYQDGLVPNRAVGYLVRVHLFLLVLLLMTNLSTAAWERYWHAVQNAQQLAAWAATDNLTGLANRRAVEQFTQALDFRTQPASVILLDLDHFKSVNDSLGHMRGDAVLQEVGARLRSVVDDPHLLARWGGEEFLIVAPSTALRQALDLARACKQAISGKPVAGLKITATCGVAESTTLSTFDDLIRLADDRMYTGKTAGRNLIIAEDADASGPAPAAP